MKKGGATKKRFIFLFVAVVLLTSLFGVFLYGWLIPKPEPIYGATFSQTYADYLELDWKETYIAVLDELEIKYIRIPIYWSSVESVEHEYNFSDIDWMMQEAQARDVKVTLVTGMKVPRWPECFIPDWALQNSQQDYHEDVLRLIEITVNRYKDHPALYRWQVENEPFFPFGVCPPADTDRFNLQEDKSDYYLTVSRLVPYKKIDLIVKAFSNMPEKKLIIVGDGPDLKKVQQIAGENITLLGFQPDDVVEKHFQQAKAFVYAAIEDFGIAPLEAQACGTPVIAYGKGGVQETVIDGKTGILYYEQSIESLTNAVGKFESGLFPFNILELRENAERFKKERFKEEIKQYVETTWANFQSRNSKW